MNTTLNLAKLISVCGGITGRKKIQKIVHLLQFSGFREPFPYVFGYLHFGPYSHGVKNDLDLLEREKLVAEQTVCGGVNTTYRYEPAPMLEAELSIVGVEPQPAWAGLARELNAYSPQQLEAASTIAFLRERQFDDAALRARFRELKPTLDHLFGEALDLLDRTCSKARSTSASR